MHDTKGRLLVVNDSSDDWQTDQTWSFDDLTPAKTVEGKYAVNMDTAKIKKIGIRISIAYGNAADGDAIIYARTSVDAGSNKEIIQKIADAFVVSETHTKYLEFEDLAYLEIGVYNGNTAVQDITISGKYAYLPR